MFRGSAAIVVVLSIWSAACSDDSRSGVATTAVELSSSEVITTTRSGATASTSFVPAEATVIGVVIAVEGNLAGIDSFVIRLEDGSDLTLVPADGLLFDGVSPLSHVRDHMVSGSPVQATYETSAEGWPTATAIGDARGGPHEHDD